VAREVLDDHDSQQHDQNGGRCQTARPRAGVAVPALAQDVMHGRTAKSVLISGQDDTSACTAQRPAFAETRLPIAGRQPTRARDRSP
jgi:hypothetical protein